MTVLTNYALKDFHDKLKEADLIIYPDNTPKEVYHFVKFCKRIMAELITDIGALRKSQGVTFRVDIKLVYFLPLLVFCNFYVLLSIFPSKDE